MSDKDYLNQSDLDQGQGQNDVSSGRGDSVIPTRALPPTEETRIKAPRTVGGWLRLIFSFISKPKAFYMRNGRVDIEGGTELQILGENRPRMYLIMQNRGPASVFVDFGSTANVDTGIEIPPNTSYEFNAGYAPYTSVNAISIADTFLIIGEGYRD